MFSAAPKPSRSQATADWCSYNGGRFSDSLDRISGQPDVLLLEAFLQSFFEPDEELPVLRRVLRVHKHASQTIAVEFSFSTPQAKNSLGLTRNSAEFLLQLAQGVSDQLLRDWAAVIKLRRQQDFVAAQGAHRWLGLRR